MNTRIAEFAQWQLRLTVQDLQRKRDPEASHLVDRVRNHLSNPNLLKASARPLTGMLNVPLMELDLGRYRLFFREEGDTLWLAGQWPHMVAE